MHWKIEQCVNVLCVIVGGTIVMVLMLDVMKLDAVGLAGCVNQYKCNKLTLKIVNVDAVLVGDIITVGMEMCAAYRKV